MIDKTRLLAGRYRLLEKIDAGGTAFIYRARDEMTGQIVAVKVLKPELTKNEEFVQRFKKEVQASLKLRHANIIRAYDAGLDNGMYYIVMDLIEGKTLKHLIQINGPLPIKYVVNIAKKLCLALEYAHVKGFVHRDIKPHNVLIDMTGEPYIADFGIAKNIAQNTVTLEDNSVMGSVHYFSPEQARGERADRRSDIYSLGILIYEALTGHVPFDADTSVAIALKHINEPMPSAREENADIPESLNRIILKATEKDKHFRYKSAFTVYEDLQRCLTEPDGNYVKYTESHRTQQHIEEVYAKRSRKNVNKVFSSIAIAVGVVAVLILILSLILNQSAGKAIQVPNVTDMDVKKAVELLADKSFASKMQYIQNEAAKDTVISQTPASDSELEEGSTVTLVVSEGTGADIMPNITNKTQQEAEEVLAQAGITVDAIVKEPEGDMPIGNVLRQEPMAGQPISPNSDVTLYVKISPDEKKIQMPDLVGSDVYDALIKLQKNGFANTNYFIFEEESALPEGQVIVQDPEKDTEQLQDQPIFLTISKPAGNEFKYTGSFEIDIQEDQTMVVAAVADAINGIPIYYTVSVKAYPAGRQEITFSDVIFSYDSEAESLQKKMVVFVNGAVAKSETVELKRVG